MIFIYYPIRFSRTRYPWIKFRLPLETALSIRQPVSFSSSFQLMDDFFKIP